MADYVKSKNIIWFSSYGGKASLAERVAQTLMRRITRLMKAKNSQNYLKQLPLIVQSYNSSFHR